MIPRLSTASSVVKEKKRSTKETPRVCVLQLLAKWDTLAHYFINKSISVISLCVETCAMENCKQINSIFKAALHSQLSVRLACYICDFIINTLHIMRFYRVLAWRKEAEMMMMMIKITGERVSSSSTRLVTWSAFSLSQSTRKNLP